MIEERSLPLRPEKNNKNKKVWLQLEHLQKVLICLFAGQQQNYLRFTSYHSYFFLFLDYIPGMHAYSAWVTPPVALFLGLAFALLCGQAHPKFNKKRPSICCSIR